jgi:uncharacterized membrane protein HdeD (DUF308 family)
MAATAVDPRGEGQGFGPWWLFLITGISWTIISFVLLAAGILEMIIGVWAIGYPGRSAWLLIIWVGIGALFRGVTEIITAFHIKGDHHQPLAAA